MPNLDRHIGNCLMCRIANANDGEGVLAANFKDSRTQGDLGMNVAARGL